MNPTPHLSVQYMKPISKKLPSSLKWVLTTLAIISWSTTAVHAQHQSPTIQTADDQQSEIGDEKSKPDQTTQLPMFNRPTRAQIATALRRYANEPSVEQVVQAALRVSANDPEDAESLASRARSAGWIPTVKMGLLRGLARDQSAYQTVNEDRNTLSTDDDLRLEASLTFHLERLVFDHNEVSIAREKRTIIDARNELIQTIVTLYFERRRLQLESDLDARPDLKRETRIIELESLLNLFTEGEFRRMMSSDK